MIKEIISNQKFQSWGGLTIILLGLCFFIFIENRNNDLLWYDRQFQVVQKHERGHEYKGKYVFDYYVEVSYSDDSVSNWIESVNGNKYFSYEVGKTYTKRDIKDRSFYNRLMIINLFFVIIGVLMLSFGLSQIL